MFQWFATQSRQILTPGTDSTLRHRALGGSVWSFAGYGLSQAVRLGLNLILTRLLYPEAFGIMALVWLVMQGLAMFSDLGIGPNIIRDQQGDDPNFLGTAMSLQLIRSIGLFALVAIGAGPFARFYDEPQLAVILPIMAFTIIVDAFASTRVYLNVRELQLGRVTALDLITQGISGVVMIIWASISPTIWALVAGGVLARVLRTILSHTPLIGPSTRPTWDRSALRRILTFGQWIFLGSMISFLSAQIDRLMLGKLEAMDVLGIYSIAAMLAALPKEITTRIGSDVLFPVMSEWEREDSPGNRQSRMLSARSRILALGLLPTVGLFFLAPAFFSLLYDARYHAAGEIVQWLCLPVWFAILQGAGDALLLSMGDSKGAAMSRLLNVIVTVPASIVCFGQWGLPGFIGGIALGASVGYGLIIIRLRSHAISTIRQDGVYTLLTVGCVGAVLGLSALAARSHVNGLEPVVYYGLSALILLALTVWNLRNLRALLT